VTEGEVEAFDDGGDANPCGLLITVTEGEVGPFDDDGDADSCGLLITMTEEVEEEL
jgi:hypothetical protein